MLKLIGKGFLSGNDIIFDLSKIDRVGFNLVYLTTTLEGILIETVRAAPEPAIEMAQAMKEREL